MPFEPLTAVSSVDGRYRDTSAALAPYLSEHALIGARVRVECRYLEVLSETKGLGMRRVSPEERHILEKLSTISLEDARIIKKIEKEGYEEIPATNHDVKAVEYFLKLKLKETSLADTVEWIHFALTSEDTDNIAYALCLRAAIEDSMGVALKELDGALDALAKKHAKTAMLARTHGQPASPTTFGKEMRVFQVRLARQLEGLKKNSILVKCAGATGNFNAHVVGAPEVNWQKFSKEFVKSFNDKEHSIKIELNKATTQIEPHDTYAELFDTMRRTNSILIGLSQDIWRYISDGWITQKTKAGEVGSSTMPHKVNPIDFENAEGNFGIANALFEHFSRKLPISRLQRDLSDSTVKRTFGTAFAHSLVGYRALLRGMGKISVNEDAMQKELENHPEVLAEAIQTALRVAGAEVPYEKLKELTRGKQVNLEDFATFVDGLSIDEKLKKRLKALRPENYIGLAAEIAAES